MYLSYNGENTYIALMKFKCLLPSLVLSVLLLSGLSSHSQKIVTLQSLLREMVDFNAVPKWPAPYYQLFQASSYDRLSVSTDKPGWFANADQGQYIREEEVGGRKENVMMDASGPGAIVRFWITTFKRNGVLRIYFDGDSKPDIIIPAYDLMKIGFSLGKALLNKHSSYEPTEKGGSTLYLPLPYAKACKVTFEDLDTDPKQPRYYQLNYRSYKVGTPVITFKQSQLNIARVLIDSIENILWHPVVKTGKNVHLNSVVAAGKETTLHLPSGSAAVKELTIEVTTDNNANMPQVLRSTILKLNFDGYQTVWCPLGDFSGSGVGGKYISSWYRSVDSAGIITTRFVMPYKKNAILAIQNLSGYNVRVSVTAEVSSWVWTEQSLYFHASWKQSQNVPIKKDENEKPIEWNFNTIAGRGIYIGNTLAVYNHMHKWYGEGDQKIWVDGGKFPVEFGTGTEDYYNTSWAPVVVYQTPFANAPRADNDDSFGYNTFTRTRNLDKVPFNKNFTMNLEMLGWENGEADFACTTYWYGYAAAKDNIADMEKEASAVIPK
jgi:hypothetical protein